MAWATAIGLVGISCPGLLKRLRQSGTRLNVLIGHIWKTRTPSAAQERLIRLIDGSTVLKADGAGAGNYLCR